MTPIASDKFPHECLMCIFAHMTLTSLIRARGVCLRWRDPQLLGLVDSTRRALLEFFYVAISSPGMERARDYIESKLIPFDRPAYISALYDQYPYMPEEFRLWILEWPAKVAIGFVWPGLPRGNAADYGVRALRGWNNLAVIPPRLYSLYLLTESEPIVTPILPIRAGKSDTYATYLIMDSRPSPDCKLVFSGFGDDRVEPCHWTGKPGEMMGKGSEQDIENETDEGRHRQVYNTDNTSDSGATSKRLYEGGARGYRKLVSERTSDGFITLGWINWLCAHLSLMDLPHDESGRYSPFRGGRLDRLDEWGKADLEGEETDSTPTSTDAESLDGSCDDINESSENMCVGLTLIFIHFSDSSSAMYLL
jgi:hypothetical protein